MRKRKSVQKQSTMNISMPASLRAEVARAMREGGFANASEYFRHLVRLERGMWTPPWLENMIEEGLKGPFESVDDKWLAARRAKLEAAIKANSRGQRKSA